MYDMTGRRTRNAAFRATLLLSWKTKCDRKQYEWGDIIVTIPFYCFECKTIVNDINSDWIIRPDVLPTGYRKCIIAAEKQFKQEYRRIRRSGG